MTDSIANQYQPRTVTPPGTTISDLIDERDIKQTELATRMDVTPKFINELIAGKATITPTTALALERALDVPADFWLVRDAHYQESIARTHADSELETHVGWLNQLPLKDMRRFGWIKVCDSPIAYVQQCLRYFGVATVDAWRAQYIERTVTSAAYRMSSSTSPAQGAIATWLRQGELEAAKVVCGPFDRAQLSDTIESAKPLTCETDPSQFIPKLTALFAPIGIAVVFVRAPKGCPVNGAVRWLSPKKALIQLSFRYLRNDSLWFTFFHECGHIYLHGKKLTFLEDGHISNAEEDEANQFAADKLIPPHEWTRFLLVRHTEQAIKQLASELGIHPGIVLGRLQKEGLTPWNRFNHLKMRYAWEE